jgi:hypothetical protein
MIENTATKKTSKPRTKSKAAQIRKLLTQGKLTPKQIAEKVDAPVTYVYVMRSKMKASAGGLPAIAQTKIPVSGGIQEVASEAEARKPMPPIQMATNPTTLVMHSTPTLAPMQITMVEQPTFFERVKERIRAWLA